MPTALISVHDKTGITAFVRRLTVHGYDKIISTGGTARALREADISVTEVADITGFPEMLDGRVKTLHPKIHGGIITRPDQRSELDARGIDEIDLVCVNLYPLEQAIADPKATEKSINEQTDIGGVALLRSAAKGRRIVVADPEQYENVLQWIRDGMPNADEFRRQLAGIAEAVAANYCLASSRYLSKGEFDGVIGSRIAECAYGENRWQAPAGIYQRLDRDGPFAPRNFQLVGGSAPSFNNLGDVDRMLQTMSHIATATSQAGRGQRSITVAVKHENCCGAASDGGTRWALQDAIRGDIRAIFGGLVMTNFPINGELADILVFYKSTGKRLLDGVVAPWFTTEAIELLSRKHGKCRLLANSALASWPIPLDVLPRIRYIRDGFLAQPNYAYILKQEDVVVHGGLTKGQWHDLLLAWAVGSTSNSNTITLVRYGMVIANAVGQQDRVGAVELALKRAADAGHIQVLNARLVDGKVVIEYSALNVVAYSDSFFPFIDGPELLLNAGVSAVLASSGSVKDAEVIKLFRDRNVPLVLVPDNVGRGFFGH